MSDLLMANLLGVETLRPLDPVSRRGAGRAWTAAAAPALDEAVSVSLSSDATGGNPAEVVARVGREMALLLNQISSSSDLEERRSLALTFRASVIEALQAAGHVAEAGSSPDKIVVNGQVFDIIGSLNRPGSPASAQFLRVYDTGYDAGGGSASGSIKEVVFAAGRERQDLLDKMNSATTEAEKTRWGQELRDYIIEALNNAGHSAFEVGKTDKIVINGIVYDILRAANGMGGSSAVQLLELKPFGESVLSDARKAIVNAGAANSALLSQISASSDMAERRTIAEQLRELVLAALRSAGFGAEAHADPDKLVVDGITYDFIKGLNSPGVAQFQALLV